MNNCDQLKLTLRLASITPLYLRRSRVIEALNGIIDPNTPGLCFCGTTGNEVVGSGNRKWYEFRLDAHPDRTFVFDAGCIKFRGERARQTAARVEETLAVHQSNERSSDGEDPDLLEDAIEEEMEEEDEPPDDEIDLCWEAGQQTTDVRLSNPDEAFNGI
ncbi:hypothetical protein [Parasitella parasitica]|uniref:Uncharacterized protein n=1 Tax=Parasitella parasitica TaxID=35722 RepID=A0A0B7NDJ6_9FUNG|nr:hypothetical protein [Parasitella parasitica]